MANSTFGTFLMHKATTSAETYTKLLDIKSFPDMGGEPDLLEITTTSDFMQKFIMGIQSVNNMNFTANWDADDFDKLKGLEGKQIEYALWIGYSGTKENPAPDGHLGKFEFTGEMSAYLSGGGVNEVEDIAFTIAPSTVIVWKYDKT